MSQTWKHKKAGGIEITQTQCFKSKTRTGTLTRLRMCFNKAGGRVTSTKGSNDCALAAQRMSVLMLDLRFVRSSVFTSGMLQEGGNDSET